MKILIENAAILTMSKDRMFIKKGYVYIDRGKIIAVDEGEPPPELEFAEYVIDGRGRIVIPGFVVGIGDILRYTFRYLIGAKRPLNEILDSISKHELTYLLDVALTSLAYNGVTSLVTVTEYGDYLDVIARASSECWIRTKIVTSEEDVSNLDRKIKSAYKNVTEVDAIAKEIVTFGVAITHEPSREMIHFIESNNVQAFIFAEHLSLDLLRNLSHLKRSVCVNCQEGVAFNRNVILDKLFEWKPGKGLGFTREKTLSPRIFFNEIKSIGNSIDRIAILSHWNPYNLDIGIYELREGNPADIVIMNFREPPAGPIPMSFYGLMEAITDGEYIVETVIVGGDVVIDKSTPIMIGEAVYRKAMKIVEEIQKEFI